MNLSNKLAVCLTGERVGAVVIFEEGTSEDEARIALSRLEKVDAHQGSSPVSFDPAIGWPVWYIP